jgi:hypothetical protein
MTKTSILAIVDFEKLFEVNYNVFRIGIRGVICQDWRLTTNYLFQWEVCLSQRKTTQRMI